MSTPIADSTAYATPADLTKRYDVRDIGQWASDTTTPVSAGNIAIDPNVLTALADASGMFEAAALTAERYTVADLVALFNAGGNSAAFLKRIICDLAIGLLLERRPNYDRDLPAPCMRALMWLDELRKGERILAFTEVAAAGNPKVTYQNQYDIQARNLATYQAARLFGADRAEEFVPGYGPSSVVP